MSRFLFEDLPIRWRKRWRGGGSAMTFEEILDQAIAMLQRRGRVTYRALKRQFNLDDAFLEDLKEELIAGQQLAVDEEGKVLVWTGGVDRASAPSPPAAFSPATAPQRAPLSYTPPYLTEKILDARHRLEGERKQVTVLFADIKDSTELIRDLDPEAAQQLLDPALRRMMDAVHRYEGTVNQVLGDGIMALFGAPIAHEDHALRACYAALAMQAAMREYTEEVRGAQGLELCIRVGLNSGEVVVRAIGNDLHMDYSAVGQTTHLAARMEQLATPGSIRLTAATLRLVEGLVRVNALGPIPVKGLAEAVEVFELVGASALRRRLQAAVARGLTRFVGRETETAALAQALEQAGVGHGQAVAVVGEAGVGKSRLLYEFVHSHRTQGWLVLEAASVSYGKATPYFPVVELLKRYMHVEDEDEPRTVRAKLMGHLLTLDEALQETIPALLALLDALPADSPFLTLDPPQRRQRILAALKRVLLRESQVQPLLLVFEDLHWIDSETQTLLDSLVESLPTAQFLLLVNYRPGYQHGWGSKTYYTQLRLDPLPPASADEFLQALLGDDPSLTPLKRLLIKRTEGNPFFLEESVRTLVETGVLVGAPEAYHLAPPVGAAPRGRPEVGNHRGLPLPIDMQVPATVQAVLAARIDRLSRENKHLLQCSAVIGTEVPLALLQAIAELPEAALQRGLAHLQAAEFLYETHLFPDHEYTFKHALTHEVAYSSLLHERRRVLHARIVESLKTLAGDRVADQVEQLAHHALRGEVWDKALAYCRQAGEKALARSAYREAVGYFGRALSALEHLPAQRDTREQAIDLRLALRNALLPLGSFERGLNYLCEAEPLAEALDDAHRLGRISAQMAGTFHMLGDPDHALVSGQRALALTTELGDVALQVMAQASLGEAYHAQGDYPRAIDVLRRNVACLESERHRARFGPYGLLAMRSYTWLVWCLSEVGAFSEGIAMAEEAVRLAGTVEDPFSRVTAYGGAGVLYLRQGDLHRAIAMLEGGLRVCQVADIPVWFSWSASALGTAYALAGRVDEAVPLLEQAVERATAMRLWVYHSLQLTSLSEAYLLAGRKDEAMERAARALALAHKHQERGNQAWALRLLGEIAVHREPPERESAEASYQQALALAEELGMRPLVAHSHLGLGLLYLKIGKGEQARPELSAAIALYRAMDMRFWLPQAEAALALVGGC
jgi:class 3 adenylate cyclase/tetratricopeptide (TPR) repeat protein